MKYNPKKKDSTLNLAPMIDIVFLLLIFFLVSSTLQGEESIYNIVIPDSSIGQRSVEEIENIFIDQNNNIYFKKTEYQQSNLEKLFSLLKTNNSKAIKIYADKKSDFESLIFLIEKLKENGFENISFALREN